MILQAPAKINLTLDVVGKREDGYHDVRMIMETVSLYDTIILHKTRGGIELKCNLYYVPTDERNIAFKAAKIFFEETGINCGISINIKKRIPVAAGLAGGSTDGAAVLKGINRMFGHPLNSTRLEELAARLGADVPYCLNGRLALAEGVGEKLTRLGEMPRTLVLLAKPDVSLSTKWVYQNLRWDEVSGHPDTDGALEAIKNGDIRSLSQKMYNVLEEVSVTRYPVIRQIEKVMLEYGALSAMMSGSGPTVFGLFDDEEKAGNAMKELKKMCGFVYLGHTL